VNAHQKLNEEAHRVRKLRPQAGKGHHSTWSIKGCFLKAWLSLENMDFKDDPTDDPLYDVVE